MLIIFYIISQTNDKNLDFVCKEVKQLQALYYNVPPL